MQREPSDEVEIGQMKEADLDQIVAIEKRSFPSPWSKRLFLETISFSSSFNIVIRKKIDNKVVGYANFYVIGDEVQVLNIAIEPESRKKGYAARLLGYAIAVLSTDKAKEFFLEVRPSNADAIRLYQGFGFEKIGIRKKYYRETNEDALVLRLKVEHGADR